MPRTFEAVLVMLAFEIFLYVFLTDILFHRRFSMEKVFEELLYVKICTTVSIPVLHCNLRVYFLVLPEKKLD